MNTAYYISENNITNNIVPLISLYNNKGILANDKHSNNYATNVDKSILGKRFLAS